MGQTLEFFGVADIVIMRGVPAQGHTCDKRRMREQMSNCLGDVSS